MGRTKTMRPICENSTCENGTVTQLDRCCPICVMASQDGCTVRGTNYDYGMFSIN